MSLLPGRRLGPYDVLGPLGAGGMGEVWRARDSTLGRQVALKLLPDALAADPDRMARFQREARLLASLNHPAIATIHGLEEAGGVRFIVLELVPGVTLAERLSAGPLAVDEALWIGVQVAEALEAAHRGGVVHRDLKRGGRPRFEFEEPDVRIDYPVWSPDGRFVLFDRFRPQGGDVWILERRE